MNASLVDSHCHLDLYGNYEQIFTAAGKSEVEYLAVTTTPLAWEQNRRLAAGFKNIQVALGLHPQLVGQSIADLGAFSRAIEGSRFVGEVGLDAGPKHYKTFDQQRVVFEEILKLCVRSPRKVLSVHCVRAFKEIFSLIDRYWTNKSGVFIFHWFSGNMADMRRAVEHDCYFSINPQMAYSESALRAVREIPISQILTETDGPFTQLANRLPREPGDVQSAIAFIAQAKSLSISEVRERIWDNWSIIKSGNDSANGLTRPSSHVKDQPIFDF